MNCKHVEDLLPLYAGHDLEDESARLINTHIDTCTHCARAAEEYVEACQLVQQFAVPQFSEATYVTVRQNVLREIEQKSGRLTLRELILSAFQPRLTWAVSTAVLLAVCAFAYYFVANRSNISPDQRATAIAEINRVGTSGGATGLATSSPKVGLNQDTPNVMAGGSPPSPRSPNQPRLSLKTQAARHSKSAGEPPAVPGSVPGAVPATIDTSVSSRKPMRLEMQTSDPNIRIIWFSQPSTNEGSPQESSKGI